jgi:hypothetical protein
MSKGSAKKVDNTRRLRYIRVLERFSSSITTYLYKTETPEKAVFDKRVDNNRKYLDRVEKADLYKGEYSDLESLVQKILGYRDSDTDIQAIADDILYSANQLEKSANRRRYKKDKHTSEKFKDWE